MKYYEVHHYYNGSIISKKQVLLLLLDIVTIITVVDMLYKSLTNHHSMIDHSISMTNVFGLERLASPPRIAEFRRE